MNSETRPDRQSASSYDSSYASSAVDRLVDFYECFSPASVERLAEYYSDDAYFKDPFNEVRGIAAIRKIFVHMFAQLEEPRFVVSDRVVDGGGTFLVWDFHFRLRGRPAAQLIRGVSHLKFDADGRVCFHRDYWDAAEELYAKLPLIGGLFRGMQRKLAA